MTSWAGRARRPLNTQLHQSARIPAATPRPSCGTSGIAIPMNPPTTHDSWSRVSDLAKALARVWSGISRWISGT